MTIALACPRCANSVPATAEMAGKRTICPQCRMDLTLPKALFELPSHGDGDRTDAEPTAPRGVGWILPLILGIAAVFVVIVVVCGGPAGLVYLLLRGDEEANELVAQVNVHPPGADLPELAPKKAMRVTEFKGVLQVKFELNNNDVPYKYPSPGGNNNNKRCKEYIVDLEAGKQYILDLESRNFDAYLRIGFLNGTKIAEDDDSGGNLNSRIRFMPAESGSYVITATSLSGGSGAYTLTVRESTFKKPR